MPNSSSASSESSFRSTSNAGTSGKQSFAFSIIGYENRIEYVTEFEVTNHAISQDYEYTVTVKSKKLEYENVIGKKALLTMNWGDKEKVYMHGIVTNVSLIRKVNNKDLYYYVVSASSPISILKYNHQNRVYLNSDVIDVVSKVINDAKIPNVISNTTITGTYLFSIFRCDL